MKIKKVITKHLMMKVKSFFGFSGDKYPGKNGTCGKVIKSHEVCEIELKYSPRELEKDGGDTHEGFLLLGYKDSFEKNEDGSLKQKEIQIKLSGASKKDRAKLAIKEVQVNTTITTYPDEIGKVYLFK